MLFVQNLKIKLINDFHIFRWLTVSAENSVILILVCALAAKFLFFDDREELTNQLSRATLISENKSDVDNMSTVSTVESSVMKHSVSLADLKINVPEKVKKPIFELSDFESEDKETQTENINSENLLNLSPDELDTKYNSSIVRSESECLEVYRSEVGAQALSDEEIKFLVNKNHIPLYKLENAIDNPLRGVKLRRQIIGQKGNFIKALEDLPYMHYDYTKVID